ncbi:MAG: hypothetical protein GWN99_05370 [Gemmatimonadetes bacterium]|uniref:Uncharacterized protein n=1 Tax=Candidatus Kutchimonas denitrificans TaxID=3056748 RepID=A0AAE4ZBS9_9BACT|nr:hypothetical protein [Gemmatimonadota bacterium]NIR76116.1 hypothetical protein [Candidatus Kutchimonas denitrificans]NIS00495.1 hypothetical protein [Gemmatimonadota bacterium]NIT66153.1 hypothetical protein [Gemmatimonadota bacterium]NIU54231.1 hypothetical protein [Gemmatimonadota bacterium]
MRLRYLVLASALVLGSSACDDTSSSGVVVGPLVGPRVVESQLAMDVIDGAPAGITDIFAPGDFVNLWIHWAELDPPHVVDVIWFDPSDQSFETTLDLTEDVSEQVTVFTLELGDFAPTGRWEVEIFIDGEFMRSHLFLVLSP